MHSPLIVATAARHALVRNVLLSGGAATRTFARLFHGVRGRRHGGGNHVACSSLSAPRVLGTSLAEEQVVSDRFLFPGLDRLRSFVTSSTTAGLSPHHLTGLSLVAQRRSVQCASGLVSRMSGTSDPRIASVVDDIIKSEEDKRLYRGLVLANGMKVLLVSDPTTDKSAAALDVHVGYMCDPKNLPGLAHFCEHMLFLGTKKYPAENEYNKFLSQHIGNSNAFTSCDHTNYYFGVGPDYLQDALDRFAQFFLCPLFTESATDKEVNAVNSEHEKNLQNDVWRLNQLDKSTSNPHHDYSKFGTGNKLTLDAIPKSQGINVREELLRFHERWYSSNIMALVVLGKESLDELTNMVVTLMSDVQNKNVAVPEWMEHPFGPEQVKVRGYVVPVQDIRNLNVVFPIPDLHPYYKSNPGHYLGHLIGHEGPGSLLSELKSRGWVNTLVGGYKCGAKGFAFFIVNVDLTEEGIEHSDDIVTLLFQYLNMLRREGPQEWVFKECQDLAAMTFRFKDRESPQMYACSLAATLHDFPMEEALCGPYLLHEYCPQLIEDLLDKLTPDNIRVAVIGKKFSGMTDSKEQWYGTEYKLEPIPHDVLDKWRNAGFHPNLQLPPRNEFVPTNFELAPREKEASQFPVIIKNTKMCRLWFKQDDEFLLPKAILSFEFSSPLAYLDPLHCNMTYLFVQLFKDALNEYTYAAELAGLSYSLSNTKYGMMLTIKGYNDKQNVLLQKIIDRLTHFRIDPKRFDILKEDYVRGLKNFRAQQPHQHAVYYTGLLLSERYWSNEELLEATEDMTVEKVESLIPQLFSKVHIEALMHGNLTRQESLTLMDLVEDRLGEAMQWRPLLPCQLLKAREFQLPDGCHYVFECANMVHRCSAIETYFQCGLQETRSNVLVELFCHIITEPCYHILRTQEQLGYIVCSGMKKSNGCLGVRIIVQSDRSPAYVDSRIEAFLQHIGKHIEEMSEEEFDTHKRALATQRLEQPKKLVLLSSKFWSEIMSQHYNFDRDRIEVACLQTLTKEDVCQFFKEMLSHTGRGRKKLAIHVASIAEGSAMASQQEEVANRDGLFPVPEGIPPATKIEDVTSFKSSLGLYPLVKPCIDVSIPSSAVSGSAKSKL